LETFLMSDVENLDNPYTRAIADFVSGLQYDDIPTEVRSRIKLLILDSLGCALYGPSLPWSQILLKTLANGDTSDTSGVWGTNQRLSPRQCSAG
jgi:aconitate decarboxylase